MIGDISPFPNILKNKLKKISSLSKTNNKIQINMALNYGSRQEIIKAINSLNKNNLKINEKNINKFLYTHDVPEPDILIRTGNTKRISNFLTWQIIYSEIFFVKKMWPDFSKNDFYKIIENYKKIERKFGGLSERTK